jgi:predicted Zn-ribbon and HTH transcriptional regulator
VVSEGVAVAFLFALSELLESFSMARARQAIQSLLSLSSETALLKNGDMQRDPRACRKCGSISLRDISELAKTECPKCRAGHFNSGEFGGIS